MLFGILASINSAFALWFGWIAEPTKVMLSLVGVVIALIGYRYTYTLIKSGDARPNPLSWIGFGILTGVAALIQLYADMLSGAYGISAWTMIVTSIACFFQGGASLYWRQGGWKPSDFSPFTKKGFLSWLTFALGVACFMAFELSNRLGLTPLETAGFATLSDLLLYGPIVFESWNSPRSEVSFGYLMQSLKNIPAIMALGSYAPEFWIYNLMLLVVNMATPAYFAWRRSAVSEEQEAQFEKERKARLEAKQRLKAERDSFRRAARSFREQQ